MKSITERWEKQDIQFLIDEHIEEGQHVDYKDSRALTNEGWKKELCKDISAFANADGGVIVYGVTEEEIIKGEKKKIRPQGFDDGIDPAKRSKEQMVQVINEGIQRRPEFHIDKIELSSSRVAYLVRIPRSNNAPHQLVANQDYRYYQRQETETQKMQDWQIRDVMNRQNGPDLWMRLADITASCDAENNNWITLKFFIKNHAITPAEYFKTTVWIDSSIFPDNPGYGCQLTEKAKFSLPDNTRTITAMKYVFPKKPNVPIFGESEIPFPNEDQYQTSWRLKIKHIDPRYDSFIVKWMIESPNMTPRYGLDAICATPWRVETLIKDLIVDN